MHGISAHLGVASDRQRSSSFELFIAGWRVPGFVGRGQVSAYALLLLCLLHEMNVARDL
jgi:hypothetical protein